MKNLAKMECFCGKRTPFYASLTKQEIRTLECLICPYNVSRSSVENLPAESEVAVETTESTRKRKRKPQLPPNAAKQVVCTPCKDTAGHTGFLTFARKTVK